MGITKKQLLSLEIERGEKEFRQISNALGREARLKKQLDCHYEKHGSYPLDLYERVHGKFPWM